MAVFDVIAPNEKKAPTRPKTKQLSPQIFYYSNGLQNEWRLIPFPFGLSDIHDVGSFLLLSYPR